jgi:hypothetical protein
MQFCLAVAIAFPSFTALKLPKLVLRAGMLLQRVKSKRLTPTSYERSDMDPSTRSRPTGSASGAVAESWTMVELPTVSPLEWAASGFSCTYRISMEIRQFVWKLGKPRWPPVLWYVHVTIGYHLFWCFTSYHWGALPWCVWLDKRRK